MAEKRAAVHAGDKAFHHVPGPQIKLRDTCNGVGMEETSGVFFFDGHGVLSQKK
jgi:hypothetical protein